MNRFSEIYLNWKVLTALALIAASIWLVAPNVVTILLPFLLITACPVLILIIVLLMKRNRQKNQHYPRIEGHLHEEQIASLKAQLRTDKARPKALEKDDTASNDQWVRL